GPSVMPHHKPPEESQDHQVGEKWRWHHGQVPSLSSRSEERRVGKECRSLCDWSSDVCSSDLGPSVMPHHKPPEESQDHQVGEKWRWHHGQVPSLSSETGRCYPMLGPIELSAA